LPTKFQRAMAKDRTLNLVSLNEFIICFKIKILSLSIHPPINRISHPMKHKWEFLSNRESSSFPYNENAWLSSSFATKRQKIQANILEFKSGSPLGVQRITKLTDWIIVLQFLSHGLDHFSDQQKAACVCD